MEVVLIPLNRVAFVHRCRQCFSDVRSNSGMVVGRHSNHIVAGECPASKWNREDGRADHQWESQGREAATTTNTLANWERSCYCSALKSYHSSLQPPELTQLLVSLPQPLVLGQFSPLLPTHSTTLCLTAGLHRLLLQGLAKLLVSQLQLALLSASLPWPLSLIYLSTSLPAYIITTRAFPRPGMSSGIATTETRHSVDLGSIVWPEPNISKEASTPSAGM